MNMLGRVKGFIQRHPLAPLLAVTVLMLGAFPRLKDWLTRTEQVPRAGALLVARPGSEDRYFRETVVLLVEADGERTWGLVLNRARAPGDEALPPGAARWGGPVRTERTRTLVRAAVAPAGAHPVLDGLSWLEGAPPAGLRTDATLTFAGLAGWAPGQLEEEIAEGGWWVLEGSVDTVFGAPESLWSKCVTRHP